MIVTIEGEQYNIPDDDIKAHLASLEEGAELEVVPPNKYIFGLNVTHTRELKQMGKDIADFMATVGEGELEIQVSVNAKLNEPTNRRIGFDIEDAIGDIEETEADFDEYEDDDWPEEDKFKTIGGLRIEKTGISKKAERKRSRSEVRKNR